MSWREQAVCRGMNPDIFFPEMGQTADRAKKICARCVVSDECRQQAIDTPEQHGVWGGLSSRELRRLRGSGTVTRTTQCFHCLAFFESVGGPAVGSPPKYCSDSCRTAAHAAQKEAHRLRAKT